MAPSLFYAALASHLHVQEQVHHKTKNYSRFVSYPSIIHYLNWDFKILSFFQDFNIKTDVIDSDLK